MEYRRGAFWPLVAGMTACLLAACGSVPQFPAAHPSASRSWLLLDDPEGIRETLILAFSLVDTGYRFGGSNPEAGLDCSGMVAYVYEKGAGLRLPHNAALMAELTRPVARARIQPGDLVFFNTGNRPYSHVGIYVGEGRFIHAPSSHGRVQISSLETGWFARRFEAARTLRPDG